MNILIVGLLLSNLGVLLVSPIDGFESFEREVVFDWSGWGKEYTILLDDDDDFNSPIIKKVTGNFYVVDDLEIGKYYWKVQKEAVESHVRSFEIKSLVGLDVVEDDEEIILRNSGNVDETISATNSITGQVVFDVDYGDEVEIEKGNWEVVAKQK